MTPPGDVEEMVSAVITLADCAPERERLGRNARRYAEDYLDKERILYGFEAELRRLTNQRS